MTNTVSRLCAILLIVFLLTPMVPWASMEDDGGTRYIVAPLYSVTLAHRLSRQEGVDGYLCGTVVRVLFIKVYDNVRFEATETNDFSENRLSA